MQLGLLGKTLSHSFSKTYFEDKFEKENLANHSYDLFELEKIEDFVDLLKQNHDLSGLNVTIPYKESVIQFLDELDETATEIGAVNTIKFVQKGNKNILKGFNTDAVGFGLSIKPFLKNTHERALILGTGGASKAVDYRLRKLGIETLFVSRNPEENQISYKDINEYVMKFHKLVINTTPLGMSPNEDTFPDIPYKLLNDSHTLIDLVYNPERTQFLTKGKQEGTEILNGMSMLHNQANESWKIWTGR
ncbi:MAG: shikimate dehydrogenase [Flavobacteriales bacterium]